MSLSQIVSDSFYDNWSGHTLEHLQLLINHFKTNKNEKIIYLAGDSSLDNKYWIQNKGTKKAINGYESILNPPQMIQDVSYWINYFSQEKKQICINASVEATTLSDRNSSLLPQDQFIRDNITENDTLIVSIGGNDIVLKPSIATTLMILWITKFSFVSNIKNNTAYGLGQIYYIFNQQIEQYIKRLIQNKKPKKIIICSIYYPCVHIQHGWADKSLQLLGYNNDQERIKLLINYSFNQCIKQIKFEGVEMEYVQLSEVLNCEDVNDFVERVEPSVQGGKKMGEKFVSLI